MRHYLESFFKEFKYEKSDEEYLLKTYDNINSHPEAKKLLGEALFAYQEDIKCDYDKIIKSCTEIARRIDAHEFTVELLMFICLSKQLENNYKDKGISREIFYNSMLDLKYKLEECKLVKGVIGSFVAFWFIGFFDMTRYALGRLQFEIVKFNHNYKKDQYELTPESQVLNMHIPRSGEPLDEESVKASLEQAADFFNSKIDEPCVFVCDSWLLYPLHTKMLPESSNIRRFMEKFDIIDNGIFRDNRELWRFFDTNEQNPERLPVNTSLRKIYVNHLKAGGRAGWGYGVIIFQK